MSSKEIKFKQFERLYSQLQDNISDIPELIAWKLEYLAKKIRGEFPIILDKNKLQEIQEFDILNKNTLIIIFNSITMTILADLKFRFKGQQEIEFQCKVKFPSMLVKFWKEGHLKATSKEITVGKLSRSLKIPFSNNLKLDIIDPKTIAILYKKVIKIWVRFQNSNLLMDFFQKQHEMRQRKIEKKQNSIVVEIKSKQTFTKLQQSQKQQINIKRKQNDQNFTIFEEKPNYIIRVHKKFAEIRIQVEAQLVEQIEVIFSALLCEKQWNQSLYYEEILNRIDKNIFMVKRRYEPASSYYEDRQIIALAEFRKINEDKGLMSIENSEYKNEQRKYATGEFMTTIYFERKNKNSTIILESAIVNNDQNVSVYQKQQILIKMCRGITKFETSFKKQRFKQVIFMKQEQQQGPRQTKISKSISSQQFDSAQEQMKRKTSDSINITISKPLNIKQSAEIQLFRKLRPLTADRIPTNQYIRMIEHNRSFQRSYLGQKFKIDQKLTEFNTDRPSYSLESLLQNGGYYEVTQEKELIFINYQIIQNQKNTLSYMIKQIGVNLFSGKSVTNVSLPVDIFESRSLLQRGTSSFGYLPHYLPPVCQATPIQQIQSLFAFIATVPTLQVNMLKPFNPILGETFQGYLGGYPIYFQQISHHPPISSYYMKCDQFTVYGNLLAFADMGLNSAVGGNYGAMHIIFKNKYHYECYHVPGEVGGLIFGKRKFRISGKGYILQRNTKLFCEFAVQKERKGIYQRNSKKSLRPGDILGGIFRVNDKFIKQFSEVTDIRKFGGIEKGHIVQKISHLSGVWFETLYINQKPIPKGKSYSIEYPQNVLPSDSNYRLDVIYHRAGDQARSQIEKQALENFQRTDKKFREKFEKQRKK